MSKTNISEINVDEENSYTRASDLEEVVDNLVNKIEQSILRVKRDILVIILLCSTSSFGLTISILVLSFCVYRGCFCSRMESNETVTLRKKVERERPVSGLSNNRWSRIEFTNLPLPNLFRKRTVDMTNGIEMNE